VVRWVVLHYAASEPHAAKIFGANQAGISSSNKHSSGAIKAGASQIAIVWFVGDVMIPLNAAKAY
jgi:hypothetical protein